MQFDVPSMMTTGYDVHRLQVFGQTRARPGPSQKPTSAV